MFSQQFGSNLAKCYKVSNSVDFFRNSYFSVFKVTLHYFCTRSLLKCNTCKLSIVLSPAGSAQLQLVQLIKYHFEQNFKYSSAKIINLTRNEIAQFIYQMHKYLIAQFIYQMQHKQIFWGKKLFQHGFKYRSGSSVKFACFPVPICPVGLTVQKLTLQLHYLCVMFEQFFPLCILYATKITNKIKMFNNCLCMHAKYLILSDF